MLVIKLYFYIIAIFKKLFYKIIFGAKIKFGKNTRFRRNFSLTIEKNGKIKIGNNCFFNNNCSLNSHNNITIGKNTIFGENVCIYDHNHRFSDVSKPISSQGYTCKPIIIGDDCWLGSNVIVLKGATIGNHVVIGANCVVKGDIPSYSIVTQDSTKQIINKIIQ